MPPVEALPPWLLTLLAVTPAEGALPLEQLEAAAPQLLTRGPDGEVWGVDSERVTVALWSIARSLLAQLELERRRSGQLDRRTRWLYHEITGKELPAASPQEGTP